MVHVVVCVGVIMGVCHCIIACGGGGLLFTAPDSSSVSANEKKKKKKKEKTYQLAQTMFLHCLGYWNGGGDNGG